MKKYLGDIVLLVGVFITSYYILDNMADRTAIVLGILVFTIGVLILRRQK
jgi:hypothetical protein